MKEHFYSNCWIEAKKAERKAKKLGKNNIKIIKIPASMNLGHMFPHYAWVDTETKTYYDFIKDNKKGQSIYFKGSIRTSPESVWASWVRGSRQKYLEKFNKAVGLDIGEKWYKCPYESDIDIRKCESGSIMIIRMVDGTKSFEILKIKDAKLRLIDEKEPHIYNMDIMDEDTTIVGWKYFNDFYPIKRLD